MKEEEAKKLAERIKKEEPGLEITGVTCTLLSEYGVVCLDPGTGEPIRFDSEEEWDERQRTRKRR